MTKNEMIKLLRIYEDRISELQFSIDTLKILNDLYNSKLKSIAEKSTSDAEFYNIIKYADSIIQKLIARIQNDDEKFEKLFKYIQHNFPNIIPTKSKSIVNMNKSASIDLNNSTPAEELSNTFVSDDGRIYENKHILDVAIWLISNLNDKLNEISGENGISG